MDCPELIDFDSPRKSERACSIGSGTPFIATWLRKLAKLSQESFQRFAGSISSLAIEVVVSPWSTQESGCLFLGLGRLLQGLEKLGFITLQVLDDIHVFALEALNVDLLDVHQA